MNETLRAITDAPGCIAGPVRVSGHDVRISTVTEPVTRVYGFPFDYNLHFCLGVENTATDPVTAKLLVNCEPGTALPDKRPLLFRGPTLQGDRLDPFTGPARTDGLRRYIIELPLAPRERAFIGNTRWRDPALIRQRIAAAGRGARPRVVGRSLDGEELVAYEFGPATPEPDRPVVFVTSGFHPPEPDTLCSMAIMERLSAPDAAKWLKAFRFVVLPVANPDGLRRGLQGSNAAGINFHWRFTGNRREECPEAWAILELCRELRPAFFLDFHCYTFQMEKRAGPYLKPLCFYRGAAVRALARAIGADLRAMTGAANTTPLAYLPTTLAAWLTAQYNTITFAKYHAHLKDGLEAVHDLGWKVLESCIETTRRRGMASAAAILKRPYGRNRGWDVGRLQAQALVLLQWRLMRLVRATRG